MAAVNGITGDDFQSDLPRTTSDQPSPEVAAELAELARMAKFARSADFKTLKAHLEQRIDFYQKYMPNGQSVLNVPTAEAGAMWQAANCIVGELSAIISSYENAAGQLKEYNARQDS